MEETRMNIIKTIQEMQAIIKQAKREGKSIGYVPTMGYLHEGHLTMMKQARENNDLLVISVFVNPLQFGPNEDFDAYPRDIDWDATLAQNAGVDYLFYPDTEEMYPNKMSISVNVNERVDVLCGRKRNGHFDGVATVLLKLFTIIGPDRTYFGLKDAQQVAVVDGLIKDYNFPIELVPVPIVREEDGLAKSSRNVYLDEKERAEAPELYKSLQKAKRMIEDGEKSPKRIISLIKDHITRHTSGVIDYVELYSYPELKPIEEISNHIIIAIAVKFSKARLIDNLTFEI